MMTNASPSARRKPAATQTDDPDLVQQRLYTAAKRYVDAGISVIPIRADGSKAPCWQLLPRQSDGTFWKPYQTRLPTQAELRRWFKPGLAILTCGIGIVCGAVSGGWEIIDFDEIELAVSWWEKVKKRDATILSKLVFVMSPRPGLHVHYRCSEIEGPHKLAEREEAEGKEKRGKTLIETRGQGNYIVVPPSPGSCHPSGQPYELLGARDLTAVQTITVEERRFLIDTARELNEYVRPARPRPVVRPLAPAKYHGGGRPGDDFSAQTSWADILEPHAGG